MKIQFLGTAASPSTPLPFCQCQVCRQARQVGGKNNRRRSSIVINEDLLIDIGPDIMSASYDHNISIADVKICLQTHFHEDHFDPEMIISRHSEYGSEGLSNLLLVGSKQTLRLMDSIVGRRCDYGSIFDEKTQESLKIQLLPLAPFEGLSIGNYIVTGYPANHGLPEHGCFVYKIEDGNCCMLYGIDTSVIDEAVWCHLETNKTKFDLVILDCTYGVGYESRQGDHLAAKDFIEHVKRFNDSGLLKETGQIYASHISHEGILEHSKYDEYAKSNGYRIAFDGLSIIV